MLPICVDQSLLYKREKSCKHSLVTTHVAVDCCVCRRSTDNRRRSAAPLQLKTSRAALNDCLMHPRSYVLLLLYISRLYAIFCKAYMHPPNRLHRIRGVTGVQQK